MAGMDSLDTAFAPTSIAIAGVGPLTTGRLYLQSLLKAGFRGKIYPLHPNGGEVDGFTVYPNVKDVTAPVEYVISCVPAAQVPQLVSDCAQKGVRVVALFTSGFSEVGSEEGRRLEAETVRLAQARGVRLIGPNCMGVYNPAAGLSFVFDFPTEPGRVGLICQSGGHTIYFVRAGAKRGLRFSKVVSYGNACDVDETDLLEYLAHDPDTEMVAAYIEGVRDAQRFRAVLSDLCARKPVAVLKGGTSHDGARTALSHTSALAGSDEAWDAVFKHAGAIRAETLEELLDMAVTFQFMRLPQGKRLAMIGGGGGASVLATDACARNGFRLPPLSPAVDRAIRDSLDSDAGKVLTNPVELNMSPESCYAIASSLLASEDFDLLMCNLVNGQSPWPEFDVWQDIACDALLKASARHPKGVAMVMQSDVSGDLERFLKLERRCYEAGVPVYHSMSGACRAINRFIRYHAKA